MVSRASSKSLESVTKLTMIVLLLVFHPKDDPKMTARMNQGFGAQLNKLRKKSPCHVVKAGDNVDCRNGTPRFEGSPLWVSRCQGLRLRSGEARLLAELSCPTPAPGTKEISGIGHSPETLHRKTQTRRHCRIIRAIELQFEEFCFWLDGGARLMFECSTRRWRLPNSPPLGIEFH